MSLSCTSAVLISVRQPGSIIVQHQGNQSYL